MTVAAGRILGILRGLRHVIAARTVSPERRAAFATVPGESPFIGINLVADMLRRDGWEIHLMVGMDQDELVFSL